MAINVTTPITGGAQTGFTSPTYTVTADVAPPGNPGEQVAVTALGGTQAGVVAHSIACPFTINFTRPASPKVIGTPNPVTGVVSNIPTNTFKVIVRKGVLPLAGQPFKVMNLTLTGDIPAGSDTADPSNIRAAYSAMIGVLQQQSAGMGDLAINGVL
ncbi:TPA_asm: coat protein [ssRNA phage Esthiorhiza.2_15]|uniref:Coat protein n=2 Tax=Norzivirales TaxID=2842247 RepID=A0A8S5L347_9VIRU|nr:coat protein [ssRNA phage Esthiorhiza.2_15]QDH90675.1 MAG: hypothetical protein H2RhizoLitter491335_000002 [Leviviridae sp.]DAD52097.1 TPA_asm: coat protein [ssRNA phage Esthiorhiza.2_15]